MNQWKKAELKVQAILASQGIKFDDVSNNPEYWVKDIDIVAHVEGGDVSIEVKNDSLIHKTGNLFLETKSDVANKKPGWFTYTEANLLYYIDDKQGLLYIYEMGALKRFANAQNEAYWRRHTKQCRDGNKTSEGLCVPLGDVSHLCKSIIRIDDVLKVRV